MPSKDEKPPVTLFGAAALQKWASLSSTDRERFRALLDEEKHLEPRPLAALFIIDSPFPAGTRALIIGDQDPRYPRTIVLSRHSCDDAVLSEAGQALAERDLSSRNIDNQPVTQVPRTAVITEEPHRTDHAQQPIQSHGESRMLAFMTSVARSSERIAIPGIGTGVLFRF